jgi:cyclopropane-fatty-acyl-phospholipid synthase
MGLSTKLAVLAAAVGVAKYGFDQDTGGVRSSIAHAGVALFEQNMLPDFVTRAGIRILLDVRLRELSEPTAEEHHERKRAFLADLRSRDIAEFTADANVQHYEVDTRFYNLVLGKYQKYSGALYADPNMNVADAAAQLEDAENRMLSLYAARSNITSACARGEKLRLMDMGCGWGSVSLWFAAKFPECLTVVGFSNSNTQRKYIMGQAKSRGLTNVDVITGNIVTFQLPDTVEPFDRVISIEMLEHMKNYELLLAKVGSFLKPGGLFFAHIFTHLTSPYHFQLMDPPEPSDWMTKYFFLGGTMPSDDLLTYFQKDLTMYDHWRVNGKHYQLTSEAWLQRMDAALPEVQVVLGEIYGEENIALWTARWRGFFLACAELFGYNEGNEWIVSHYLFQKPSQ